MSWNSTPEQKKALENLRIIFEMIDASIDLSVRKGKHPLEPGCNCIACVNRRKDMLRPKQTNWKHRL